MGVGRGDARSKITRRNQYRTDQEIKFGKQKFRKSGKPGTDRREKEVCSRECDSPSHAPSSQLQTRYRFLIHLYARA